MYLDNFNNKRLIWYNIADVHENNRSIEYLMYYCGAVVYQSNSPSRESNAYSRKDEGRKEEEEGRKLKAHYQEGACASFSNRNLKSSAWIFLKKARLVAAATVKSE